VVLVSSVPAAFASLVATDPARPLLTWYDDATGERTELSGATLSNWVAKTANLLTDGCGLGPGDVAAVRTPPHWQTFAIYLAAWTAGLAVTHSASSSPDVAFLMPSESAAAPDSFAVGLHPFALPVSTVQPGVLDWVSSARVHGDYYTGPSVASSALALVDLPGGGSVTQGDLVARGLARASSLGLTPGSRVLLSLADHPQPVDWLVAPLVAGCTLVAVAHADPSTLDARAATERAVRIVGAS
jgi:uncharacterized protein (TIGR03089 family)